MHTNIVKNIVSHLTILTIVGTLLVVTSVHAQAIPEPVQSREANRVQLNGSSSVRDNIQEKMVERRMAISQNMQDRIINLSMNATNRLKAGTNRMTNIITRIESRIVKLKAEGIDTAPAEERLSAAKISLSDADTAIAQLGSTKNAITSDDFRGAFAPIRIQFIAIRDLLRQTHVALQETVLLLKGAGPKSSEIVPEAPPVGTTSENRLEVQ